MIIDTNKLLENIRFDFADRAERIADREPGGSYSPAINKVHISNIISRLTKEQKHLEALVKEIESCAEDYGMNQKKYKPTVHISTVPTTAALIGDYILMEKEKDTRKLLQHSENGFFKIVDIIHEHVNNEIIFCAKSKDTYAVKKDEKVIVKKYIRH